MAEENSSDNSDVEFGNEGGAMEIILRLLLRSGQVRIQRRGASRWMDSLEREEDQEENEQEDMDTTTATEQLLEQKLKEFKSSDFVQDIYHNIGKLLNNKQDTNVFHGITRSSNLTEFLRLREIGCCGSTLSRNFNEGAQTQIKSSLIPNVVTDRKQFNEKLFCGTYSDDGNLFLSACQDRHLRLYNAHEFTSGSKPIKNITARDVGWSILDVSFSSDCSLIAYSSWSDSVHLIKTFSDDSDSNHSSLSLDPEQHNLAIFSLKFSTSGSEILCGANDGYLYVYDMEKMCRTARIDAHEDDVNAVCFGDKATNILYSGADDGLVRVWDRRSLSESNPQPVGVLAGHRDGITYIDTKNDGRYLLSNSKDQSIKLWDIRKFSSSETINTVRQVVSRQSWDYRWQCVPQSAKNPKLKLIPGDTSIHTYTGHQVLNTLIRARFSPMHSTGQRYIYSGCSTGKMFIYDSISGDVVSDKCKHKNTVRDVSWHPFEPKIISSSWDGCLAQWQYKTEDKDENNNLKQMETDEPLHSMQLRSRKLVRKTHF